MSRMFRYVRRCAGALLRGDWGALRRSLLSPLRRLRGRFLARRERQALAALLQGRVEGRRVLLFPPTLEWNMALFQRPQQLALSYARQEDTLVLYLTACTKADRVRCAEEIAPNLFLVHAALAPALPHLLRGARERIVSLSWTVNRPYLELLRPDRVIYEVIDELTIFDGYDRQMEREHRRLLRRADLVVCTARKLYEDALPYARRAILSPNAGDWAHFSKTAEAVPDETLRRLAAPYKAVLGYYGALAQWLDYPLLLTAARQHGDWLFVLLGLDYDGSLARSGVAAQRNILCLPPQPYARLPEFLTLFDLALIPFVLNSVTQATSPVKLFEYMAAGKPILCSAMPECLQYESVSIYTNPSDFCQKAEALLARKDDPALQEKLKKDALANTWDARTEEILTALEGKEEGKSRPL